MLHEWKRGDETQGHAVPGYIYLVLVLGAAASVGNALGFLGACSRSVCLLSFSLGIVLPTLLLEGALALVLLYNPSLVDTQVCPPGDAACLQRVDHIFTDPSAHAGRACPPPGLHPPGAAATPPPPPPPSPPCSVVSSMLHRVHPPRATYLPRPPRPAGVTVAAVGGAQSLAMLLLLFLRRSTRLLYNNTQDVDAIFWDRGGLRRTLLEEQEWRNSRDDFEERRCTLSAAFSLSLSLSLSPPLPLPPPGIDGLLTPLNGPLALAL